MSDLDFSYPNILGHFGKHAVPGRTDSRAFLSWFLANYFRLEESSVEDSICDGPDDKGVDGVYLDTTLEVIYVFQAKLYQNNTKTLGDASLREFAGTLSQFSTPESVNALAKETGNIELRGLLESEGLASRINDGYDVSGIFITNAAVDENGRAFVGGRQHITVYDRHRLSAEWVPLGDTKPVDEEVQFHLDGLGVIRYQSPAAIVYVASLRGTELVQLAGIENQSLFAWNVRQSLGRTKVNRAIAENVNNAVEHKNFMLYHNGLTILATSVQLDPESDVLRINGYSVVNGAQSLSTLHQYRTSVSDDLRLLSRVVELSPASDLAAMITRNSNNQNAIGARDMQSNSDIQKRLKEDFRRTFKNEIGYEIKRGELAIASHIITNEEAARVLLAFDLEQPWTCHQSYRYFDDLHSDIFARPVVTAARIAALVAVRNAVLESLTALKSQLTAKYSVTPYFLMFLVKQALMLDPTGKEFCQKPDVFVLEVGMDGIQSVVKKVADDLVIDLNAELEDRATSDSPFDHKRELKSATAVRALRNAVIPGYQKAVRRNRATSFSDEWHGIRPSGPAHSSSA